ncbi:MAG: DUF475 domain-containing protein [Candidatus Micrarchaeia archaeon]
MDFFSLFLTVMGLTLFEVITSVDNAIINAHVLNTMGQKARKWFLVWGLLIAVFLVRGLLPWLIVFFMNPQLGFFGSLTATFSEDPMVLASIEESKPILLIAGGIFMVFLFLHWLFLEPKYYGLRGEKTIEKNGIWFYAIVSLLLTVLIYLAVEKNPMMALGAAVGSSLFFITHGFKQNAESKEKDLLDKKKTASLSDLSKLFYLEVIDATFSIDSVLGAFAFTLSVPLILIGNGIGAFVVRELTIKNVTKVKNYKYLKNGAMYSIFFLGVIMIYDAFGGHIPEWVSPIITFAVVGWFYFKSLKVMGKEVEGSPN